MNRRNFISGLVGIGALWATGVEASERVLVVYIGAQNCKWCPSFENQKWRPFLQSDLARKVTTRSVKTFSFNFTGEAEEWPADLRWVIDAVGVKSGTPKVVILKGTKKIYYGKANGKSWEEKVLPAIQKALG